MPGTGNYAMKEGKVSTVSVDSTPDEQNLSVALKAFYVPAESGMIQVKGAPLGSSGWTSVQEPEQLELSDSDGKKYQPNGFLVMYKAKGTQRFLFKYYSANAIPGSSVPADADAPTEVTLIYLVPKEASIVGFYDHGQKVKDVQVKGATK